MNNKKYSQPASNLSIENAKKALEDNGFTVIVARNREDAKIQALKLIPEKSEVLTATSQTLEESGINSAINETGKYNAVKPKLMQMNRETESLKMQKMGAAPEYVIGSVHSVTEDGHVLIASATGSQLASYAYGAPHVVWVVGTQKIVKNLEEANKRLEEYVFPLEDERALKAYGGHTGINKILIVNKEYPGRITIIFVKEPLGF